MCGLAGIFDPGGKPSRPAVEAALAQLLAEVRHRGPDGEGAVFESGLALGHRRLAILDPSDAGVQPMESRDRRYLLAHNGEIYNHLDLRRHLDGPWRGASDTETLLAAFSARGLQALTQACGMFALVLYDRHEGRLHLIRDRFGIKPLFWAVRSEGGWVFASQARTLARATGAAIRRDVLSDYLAWGYPPPGATLFEGVNEVAPGEVLTLSASGASRQRYYEMPLETVAAPTVKEQDEAFDHAFRRSVKEHQLSDVPVGVLLSSGVDSSAVAVASAPLGSPLTAFTVRFGDEGLDESAEASSLARRIGLTEVTLSVPSQLDRATLEAVAVASDLPMADSSSIGTWLIAREASKHVKVLLTGDGADETWGGYQTYSATGLVGTNTGRALGSLGRALDSGFGPAKPRSGRPGPRMKLSRFARYEGREPLEAHRRWRTLVDDPSLQALGLGPPDSDHFQGHVVAAARRAGLNAALALDVSTYLVQDELVRLDRMAMAHGVEGRVPFLDHRLVELAFSWAPEVKRRRGLGKRPVRRWLQGQGFNKPARAPKRGFNHPVGEWMAGEAGDWLLDGRPALSALLDVAPVETWLTEHRSKARDRSYELFSLLLLERFLVSLRP